MKIYLVIKRFVMDDVPVLLTENLSKARQEAANIEKDMIREDIVATETEKNIMNVDISNPLVGVEIITFGDDGKPLPDEPNYQFWKICAVRTVKQLMLKNIETADECICEVDAKHEPFLPIKMPKIPGGPAERKSRGRKPVETKPERKPKRSSKATQGKSKRKKSEYKGVSPMRPTAAGKQRFQVVWWDGKNKKCVTIGIYETELAAAVLRAQAKQQQADMAEQAENNPNRPPAKKKKKKIWVCLQCGIEYRTNPTKNRCIHCGKNDFREVPVE